MITLAKVLEIDAENMAKSWMLGYFNLNQPLVCRKGAKGQYESGHDSMKSGMKAQIKVLLVLQL
jgi:hypothetical protein